MQSQIATRPGLLVSVRNVEEALAALAGGADVIDVKEPDRGPLGAADSATIGAVVHAVNGRAPVTAAMGELTDMIATKCDPVPNGVALFKIGLRGCGTLTDWQSRWRNVIDEVNLSCRERPHSAPRAAPVAVVYADWLSAGAPEPTDVLNAALEVRCPALLIDTWDKAAGSLFDHWPPERLTDFLQSARAHGLLVVLAGSLANENIAAAAKLAPDLVAVRAAACKGGRRGAVSATRVRALQALLASAAPEKAGDFDRSKIFLDTANEFRILETTCDARADGLKFAHHVMGVDNVNVLDAIRGGDWFFEPEIVESDGFQPTSAIPGTPEKLDILAERARAGLPLWHTSDRMDYDEPGAE